MIWRQADVRGDLAQEDRRDVAALVKRNSREPPIGVPELLVRASLPDLDGAQNVEKPCNLCGFQDREVAQATQATLTA